jgi:rSAM/selenodomain-associated transferase 2
MGVDLAVVIPTLNEEGTIESCMEAVGEDSGQVVVVSDGGSEDSTPALAARLGARVVQGPRGRGPQLNRGAAEVEAEAYLFLHADCRLPPGWREALRGVLEDRSTALACFRLYTEPAGKERRSRLYRMWLRVFDFGARGLRAPYGDQGLAVRREIFEAVGGFPAIPLMEDVAFAQACLRVGRIRRLPMEMHTTARRFESSPFRTGLMFVTFPTLYRLGVSPNTLARWYGASR